MGKKIRVASTDDWREIVGVCAGRARRRRGSARTHSGYWPAMLINFEGQKSELRRVWLS